MVGFLFMTSDFGNCSEFCGVGRQTRNVTCVMTVNGVVEMEMEDEACLRAGVSRPSDTQNCNTFSCPVFVLGPFGQVRK